MIEVRDIILIRAVAQNFNKLALERLFYLILERSS
jgi:hypothetical protein